MTDRVLKTRQNLPNALPIVHRAVLRFALQSPTPNALAYVAIERKKAPDRVADAEELLRLDKELPPQKNP